MISIPESYGGLDRVPFKLKVIMLVSASTFSLICWNAGLLAAGLIMGAFPMLFIKSKRIILNTIKLFLLLALSFIISQALFYWGLYSGEKVTILLYIFKPGANPIIDALTMNKGIAITLQGIYWGIESATKFGITYFSALWVIYTTRPSKMLESIYSIKLPQAIKLSALAAFRVLPVMVEDMESVIAVSRARKPSSFKKRLLEPFTVVRSMIFNSVKRAYHLSMALEIRGMPKFRAEAEEGNRPMAAFTAAVIIIYILLIAFSLY